MPNITVILNLDSVTADPLGDGVLIPPDGVEFVESVIDLAPSDGDPQTMSLEFFSHDTPLLMRYAVSFIGKVTS